jgi:hypothetical protein
MLTILGSRIDTLEAGFRGQLKPGLDEALERAKRAAQAENLPQSFLIEETELFMQPKGLAPWSYLLTNEEFHLRASGKGHVPCVSVRLAAFGLALRGHEALWAQAKRCAQAIGGTEGAISRLDIAVDFQGHVPTYEEMRDTTCPSGFRPVYPNTEHPETFQFGKGDVVVRLYNKTKQMKDERKPWMQELWAGQPDYRPDEDVWRFEAQYRREALRGMGIISVEEAFKRLQAALIIGLYWIAPRVRTEDNLSRCELQAWWRELLAKFPGEPLPRIKQAKRVSGFNVLVPQMLGLLVSAAAYAEVYTVEAAMRLQMDAFRSYIADHDKSFGERVRERQRLLAH